MERPSIDASHVRRAQSTNAKSASRLLRRQPQHGATPAAQGPVDAQQAPPVASPAMAMATALRRAAPPVARPRLARGSGTTAAQKCRIAASRGVSVIRAYGDRRRNDDAPRGGGGWTNEFGDEYDAIDDDDGYFEERRAPAGRPTAAGRPTGGDDSTMTADAEGSAARRWRPQATRRGRSRRRQAKRQKARRRRRLGRGTSERRERARGDALRETTAVVSTINLKPRGCAFFVFSRV